MTGVYFDQRRGFGLWGMTGPGVPTKIASVLELLSWRKFSVIHASRQELSDDDDDDDDSEDSDTIGSL